MWVLVEIKMVNLGQGMVKKSPFPHPVERSSGVFTTTFQSIRKKKCLLSHAYIVMKQHHLVGVLENKVRGNPHVSSVDKHKLYSQIKTKRLLYLSNNGKISGSQII